MEFTNKVILITGASAGIGAETAEYFAKLGGQLALTGRNAENLKIVAEKCTFPNVKAPLCIVADIITDGERIVNETIKYFGKLNILINNAGRHGYGTIETATMDTYDQCTNTNVRGVFKLTQLAVPHLLKTKGNIVNVSSVGGIRSYTDKLPYCMSKSAIDQFTKCTALELGPKGVRVNAVNPGLIITNFQINGGSSKADYDQLVNVSKKITPLRCVGYVEDVSRAIAFLASDNSKFITGICLNIDGGAHIM